MREIEISPYSTKKQKSQSESENRKAEIFFSSEAEELRKQKQDLTKKLFANMNNFLNSDSHLYYNEVISKIYRVCFDELDKEEEMEDKKAESMSDVLSQKALEQYKDMSGSSEIVADVSNNSQTSSGEQISSKDEISKHVMYRVLVNETIDWQKNERDVSFIYDDIDKKVEAILNKFAKAKTYEEFAELEKRLDAELGLNSSVH